MPTEVQVIAGFPHPPSAYLQVVAASGGFGLVSAK